MAGCDRRSFRKRRFPELLVDGIKAFESTLTRRCGAGDYKYQKRYVERTVATAGEYSLTRNLASKESEV